MENIENIELTTTPDNLTVEDVNEESEERNIPNETKEEKFLRLAPPRVNKIIHSIDVLGKLSSSGGYSPEQVEKMFGAIQETLDETKGKFMKTKKEEPKSFSF